MKYILIFCFLIAGCAYPKRTHVYTPVKPVKGKAIVYLYRPNTAIDAANPDVPQFFISDQRLGKLIIGGYYVAIVDPGQIKLIYKETLFGILLPWKMREIEFYAHPDKSYYVKFSIETIFRNVDFRMVDPYQGQEEISDLGLLVN
jgi:hypothetical protein